jgi:hypothetical protein
LVVKVEAAELDTSKINYARKQFGLVSNLSKHYLTRSNRVDASDAKRPVKNLDILKRNSGRLTGLKG